MYYLRAPDAPIPVSVRNTKNIIQFVEKPDMTPKMPVVKQTSRIVIFLPNLSPKPPHMYEPINIPKNTALPSLHSVKYCE